METQTTTQIIEQQKKEGKFISLTLEKLKEYTDKFKTSKELETYNIIFVNGVVLQIRKGCLK